MTHSFRATGRGTEASPGLQPAPAALAVLSLADLGGPPGTPRSLGRWTAVACYPWEMKSFSFQQAALKPENQTPKT